MKTKKLMKNEINKRMESYEWNLKIAGKVMERKRGRKKSFILSLSAFSAAAAVLLFIIFGISNEKTGTSSYESMISRQVQGTYQEILTGTKKKTFKTGITAAAKNENQVALEAVNSNFEEILISDETDAAIDDALAMR